MKIVATKKDVDSLVEGEQYVIQPKGFDPSDGPENVLKHIEAINELQTYTEQRFSMKKKKNDKS